MSLSTAWAQSRLHLGASLVTGQSSLLGVLDLEAKVRGHCAGLYSPTLEAAHPQAQLAQTRHAERVGRAKKVSDGQSHYCPG